MGLINQTRPLTTRLPLQNNGDDEEEKTSSGVWYFFIVYYGIVFFAGLIGNIVIIASVTKFKRMRSVVNIFLVNLAIADLMFVLLSIFDAITFLHDGQWIFGDVFCRIQGSLIELSFTVSVCTLTVIAAERYMSICRPHKIRRTLKQAIKVCFCVWLFSVLFCACLMYGYGVRPDKDGVSICRNDNWSKKSRLIFYTIHSIVIYLVPLAMMIFSHYRISRALILQRMRTLSSFACSSDHIASSVDDDDIDKIASKPKNTISHMNIQKELKRNAKKAGRRAKVIKLLVVVTTVFFFLWTPFVAVRLLKYFNFSIDDLIWRGSQLLIFGNTAVNCFIYALMSPTFRSAFKSVFICQRSFRNHGNSISRSFDVSETMKRQTSIKNNVVLKVANSS